MKKCSVPECDNRHHARGLCQKHNLRMKKYGTLTLEKKHYKPVTRKCEEKDCDRKHYAKGYCHMHYARNYRASKKKGEQIDATPDKIKLSPLR